MSSYLQHITWMNPSTTKHRLTHGLNEKYYAAREYLFPFPIKFIVFLASTDGRKPQQVYLGLSTYGRNLQRTCLRLSTYGRNLQQTFLGLSPHGRNLQQTCL
ncbi:MAG: hypothetical protein LBM08_02715 [Dysgonamonadaceae bacterium]|jgi:hypothetical protein|nr:hypothetical protein [Dysgonamonadaceae bacterium]